MYFSSSDFSIVQVIDHQVRAPPVKVILTFNHEAIVPQEVVSQLIYQFLFHVHNSVSVLEGLTGL